MLIMGRVILREIYLFNVLFSVICCYFFIQWGPYIFPIIFWLKLVTLAGSYVIQFELKKNKLILFQNLGISKRKLILIIASADLVLLIGLMILTDVLLRN